MGSFPGLYKQQISDFCPGASLAGAQTQCNSVSCCLIARLTQGGTRLDEKHQGFFLRGTWHRSGVYFSLYSIPTCFTLCPARRVRISFSLASEPFYYKATSQFFSFFFPHVLIHIPPPPPPKSSPGTSHARRPAALATEPLGSRGARQKGPGVGGAFLPFHRLGTTVRRNSFWKRATVTTRIQVSVFVWLQILDGGRKARLGAITRKRLSSSHGILRIQSDKKKL